MPPSCFNCPLLVWSPWKLVPAEVGFEFFCSPWGATSLPYLLPARLSLLVFQGRRIFPRTSGVGLPNLLPKTRSAYAPDLPSVAWVRWECRIWRVSHKNIQTRPRTPAGRPRPLPYPLPGRLNHIFLILCNVSFQNPCFLQPGHLSSHSNASDGDAVHEG